jgi:hypothetical protein
MSACDNRYRRRNSRKQQDQCCELKEQSPKTRRAAGDAPLHLLVFALIAYFDLIKSLEDESRPSLQ